MLKNLGNRLAAALSVAALGAVQACGAASGGTPVPAPASDIPASSAAAAQTAVFAGGCFWGVDAVYRHVKGVTNVVSGYAGGTSKTADYETVSTGTTGHAESVQVTYDPSQVSYGELLRVFFSVAHDPTQLNQAKVFGSPIVTEVVALPAFYPAESYHQNYLALHRNQPYIVYNDLPKLAALKQQFPDRYK